MDREEVSTAALLAALILTSIGWLLIALGAGAVALPLFIVSIICTVTSVTLGER